MARIYYSADDCDGEGRRTISAIETDVGRWAVTEEVSGYRVWHGEGWPLRAVALIPINEGPLAAADCVAARIEGGYY